jgi:hypothetical protein
MKVNEFKKIEEGLFSDLAKVGSDTVDAARSIDPARPQRANQVELQKRYLQDFIKDLNADLTSAIANKAIKITAPAQTQQQPSQAPAQTQQPQLAVQPTAQTRQAALQRTAQRQQQKAQKKPVDSEEELTGVADLGYNENIKFDKLNTLIEGIISEQLKLYQKRNGIK